MEAIVDATDIVKNRVLILFNPNHDRLGRFATKIGSGYSGPKDHSKDMPKYEDG